MNKNIRNEEADKAFRFTDMYLNLNNWEDSYLYPGRVKMEEDQKKYIEDLYNEVKRVFEEEPDKLDQLVILYGHFFRCHKIDSVSSSFVAIRKMPTDLKKIDDTGLYSEVKKNLLHPRLRTGGLVFIAGTPGNGKTTTCAATIVSRLEKFGGVCLTIEDPPEIPMDGPWGEGICIQTEAPSEEDGGFSEGVRGAMRSYPSSVDCMMLIGELRDPETAALTLRAAIDGRLVLTTLHSDSVITGLQRIASLASQVMDENEVYSLLAESFRIGIHQKLDKGVVKVTCLVDTDTTFGYIQQGRFKFLSSDLEKQAIILQKKGKIAYKNN